MRSASRPHLEPGSRAPHRHGETVGYRADERFGYASCTKALSAAAVLAQSEPDDLDDAVVYGAEDLVDHSPVTEQHVDTGMPLRDVIDAVAPALEELG